jgi:hypothetical protein
MHFDNIVGWKPSCEIDGSYSAKQCRGDNVTGRFVILCRINLIFCHFIWIQDIYRHKEINVIYYRHTWVGVKCQRSL